MCRLGYKITITHGAGPTVDWNQKEITVGEFFENAGGISDTINYHLTTATNVYDVITDITNADAVTAAAAYTVKVFAYYQSGMVSEERSFTSAVFT